MQQVTVEGIFDSDGDEDYPSPQSVHCKTHEVQVNAHCKLLGRWMQHHGMGWHMPGSF